MTGCNFAIEGLALALMNLHVIDHQLKLQAGPPHPPQQPVTNTFNPRSVPKLEWPKLNATNEEWNMRWCTYRTGSNILDDTATMQHSLNAVRMTSSNFHNNEGEALTLL